MFLSTYSNHVPVCKAGENFRRPRTFKGKRENRCRNTTGSHPLRRSPLRVGPQNHSSRIDRQGKAGIH